jgi:hypothetical protein
MSRLTMIPIVYNALVVNGVIANDIRPGLLGFSGYSFACGSARRHPEFGCRDHRLWSLSK